MSIRNIIIYLLLGLVGVTALSITRADEVQIVAADFQQSGKGVWSVSVTLQHGDTGWDHYADNWRVVDAHGNVLGNRVLYHPHVNEQPFTRSQGGVRIPEGIQTLYIEAHDKVHGWTEKRLQLDLTQAVEGRLRVTAE